MLVGLASLLHKVSKLMIGWLNCECITRKRDRATERGRGEESARRETENTRVCPGVDISNEWPTINFRSSFQLLGRYLRYFSSAAASKLSAGRINSTDRLASIVRKPLKYRAARFPAGAGPQLGGNYFFRCARGVESIRLRGDSVVSFAAIYNPAAAAGREAA